MKTHSFDKKNLIFNTTNPNFYFVYMNEPSPEPHTKDFWEIMAVTDGVTEFRINNIKRALKPNTVCLMRPNDVCSLHAVEKHPQSRVHISIREQGFKEWLGFLDANLYAELLKPLFIEVEVPQSTTNYVMDIVYKLQSMDKRDPAYHRLTSLLFFDLFHVVLYNFTAKQISDANHPAPVKELIKFMYDIENITRPLEELYKKTNYSQSYLVKQFKKHLKMTPVRFFQNIKTNHARILLETTDLSIWDIAERIGISNIEHFYNTFKKAYGVPPAKYRKNWHSYYNSFSNVPPPV